MGRSRHSREQRVIHGARLSIRKDKELDDVTWGSRRRKGRRKDKGATKSSSSQAIFQEFDSLTTSACRLQAWHGAEQGSGDQLRHLIPVVSMIGITCVAGNAAATLTSYQGKILLLRLYCIGAFPSSHPGAFLPEDTFAVTDN